MALKGTLSDFGLPDIFQLVGHQQKTGVLLLKDRDLEVRISFVNGNVVNAEQSSRDLNDLLGTMMLRAGVLSEVQLANALDVQRRTLRRLGDILVEQQAADRPTIREFAKLQTTETIYRLFLWRRGTYEFSAVSVDYDEQSYEPIRAENVLMEGFRMVDEWPGVRKLVPHVLCTFQPLKPLPDETSRAADEDILAGMEDALAEDSVAPTERPSDITTQERRVYALTLGDRTVQSIIDVSRLGEFETTKALSALVARGYLRVHMPSADALPKEAMTMRRAVTVAAPHFVRVALSLCVAALVFVVARHAGDAHPRTPVVHISPTRDALLLTQGLRVRGALEALRYQDGKYPSDLSAVVAPQALTQRALEFPVGEAPVYRRDDKRPADAYALSRPLR